MVNDRHYVVIIITLSLVLIKTRLAVFMPEIRNRFVISFSFYRYKVHIAYRAIARLIVYLISFTMHGAIIFYLFIFP
jgi:hypothetical protein